MKENGQTIREWREMLSISVTKVVEIQSTFVNKTQFFSIVSVNNIKTSLAGMSRP